MIPTEIIRMVKKNIKSFFLYDIYGLNILASNRSFHPDRREIHDMPFLEFFRELMDGYQTIILIGAPGMNNWMNEKKYKLKKEFSVKDFLGEDKFYVELPMGFYDAEFIDSCKYNDEYGNSILLECKPEENALLLKLLDAFTYYGALAFVLYEKGKDGFGITKKKLEGEISKIDTIDTVLQEARFFITQDIDECWLKIYTRSNDVENELKTACAPAQQYIESTAWYQANKNNLVWDELEGSYLVMTDTAR